VDLRPTLPSISTDVSQILASTYARGLLFGDAEAPEVLTRDGRRVDLELGAGVRLLEDFEFDADGGQLLLATEDAEAARRLHVVDLSSPDPSLEDAPVVLSDFVSVSLFTQPRDVR